MDDCGDMTDRTPTSWTEPDRAAANESEPHTAVLKRRALDILVLVFKDEVNDACFPVVTLSLRTSSKFLPNHCPACTAEAELIYRKKATKRDADVKAQLLFFDIEMVNFRYYEVSQWALRLKWGSSAQGPPAVKAYIMDKQGEVATCTASNVGRRLHQGSLSEPLLIEAIAETTGVGFRWVPCVPDPPLFPPLQLKRPLDGFATLGQAGISHLDTSPSESGEKEGHTTNTADSPDGKMGPCDDLLSQQDPRVELIDQQMRRFRPIAPRPAGGAKSVPTGDVKPREEDRPDPKPHDAEGSRSTGGGASDTWNQFVERPEPGHLELAEVIEALDESQPEEFEFLQKRISMGVWN
jgi:hypothetical protein